ncbi:MAG TPA: hypothetical protein VNE62_12205, partial [Actinomycetota bacterium]|nr:hypothetical protein [Actinomycetota bacterium]
MRRVALMLTVILVGSLPLPAGAATHSIDAGGTSFTPRLVTAAAGDQIRWDMSSGFHTVTAWEGATFDSGPLSPGDQFSAQFPGGTVRYRCVPHSSLTDGQCSGMCGVISDRMVTAPIIRTPTNGQRLTSPNVTFDGTVTASVVGVEVSVDGVLMRTSPIHAGEWSYVGGHAEGTHVATAVALDADGFRSQAASVTFTIDLPDDFEPPEVTMHSISDHQIYNRTAPAQVLGSASDDTVVGRIEVLITSLAGLGAQRVVVADCQACPSPEVPWTATARLDPGIHTVQAQ